MRRLDELIAVYGNQTPEASSLEAYLFSIRSLDLVSNQQNYALSIETLRAQEQILRDADITFPELQDLPGLLNDPGAGTNPEEKLDEGAIQVPDQGNAPHDPADDETNQSSLQGSTATLVPDSSLP
ncbi:MAG: hypothetical protein DWG76_02475 [Chloroflexi bacterium]|nr:hypothetical protein [Chloroflexota bacterium]